MIVGPDQFVLSYNKQGLLHRHKPRQTCTILSHNIRGSDVRTPNHDVRIKGYFGQCFERISGKFSVSKIQRLNQNIQYQILAKCNFSGS